MYKLAEQYIMLFLVNDQGQGGFAGADNNGRENTLPISFSDTNSYKIVATMEYANVYDKPLSVSHMSKDKFKLYLGTGGHSYNNYIAVGK